MKEGGRGVREGDRVTEPRSRVRVMKSALKAEGVLGHGVQAALEAGKGRDRDSSTADSLILARGDPCLTSGLQNCETKNLLCLKALSLRVGFCSSHRK